MNNIAYLKNIRSFQSLAIFPSTGWKTLNGFSRHYDDTYQLSLKGSGKAIYIQHDKKRIVSLSYTFRCSYKR